MSEDLEQIDPRERIATLLPRVADGLEEIAARIATLANGVNTLTAALDAARQAFEDARAEDAEPPA